MTRMVGSTRWWLACAASSLAHLAIFTLLPPPGSLNGAPPTERTQSVVIDLMPPPPAEPPPAEPEPEEPEPTPEELEMAKRLALGIDADTPDSDTWLGHDTFLEHRAVPADFDQAAFTTDATASAPPPPSVQPTPTVVPPSPMAPSLDAVADAPPPQDTPHAAVHESSVPPEMREVDPVALPLDEGELPELEAEETATDSMEPKTEDEEPANPQAGEDPQRVMEAVMAALGLSVPPPPPASPEPPTPIVPTQPVIAPPAEGDPSVGERSDKQSDPTSIINVPRDQWQLGKPLAAHGLQLKPVKPKLTVLTSMTAAPCNPLAVLRFEGNGVPKDVTLLQGSCDSRVDEAVLSALYRWRAEGKELLALRPGETIDIRIRLILNPRGRIDDDV